MRKLFKTTFIAFSVILLLYMIWPFGPHSIVDFPALPQSAKSILSGDTTEVKNVSAYFSNNYRKYVVYYYNLVFQGLSKFPIPPLVLNYPPEEAFSYIKDQTQSTYLEEVSYPLRDSIFINGLEPYEAETLSPRYEGASMFTEGGQLWQTKVTLRYYPSTILSRIIVWISIILSFILLSKTFYRIKNG